MHSTVNLFFDQCKLFDTLYWRRMYLKGEMGSQMFHSSKILTRGAVNIGGCKLIGVWLWLFEVIGTLIDCPNLHQVSFNFKKVCLDGGCCAAKFNG